MKRPALGVLAPEDDMIADLENDPATGKALNNIAPKEFAAPIARSSCRLT